MYSVQVTSHTVAQFVAGRFIVYVAVGLVENVVPTYQSEIAPAALRGFFVGSIQLCLTLGALVAGIVNEVLSSRTNASGWQIATGVQAIPAVIILCGLSWTSDSPRWLLSRDRAEDALAALRRVRRSEDVAAGACEVELAAMEEDGRAVRHKGPWRDLYRGTNRRRTNIACAIMAFQQLTGVTFSSAYGPTFYKSVGLGNMAFAYSAISNGVSMVTALIAMVIFDAFGRRDVTFHGCWTQAVFLALIGALGSKTDRSTGDTRGMVASFILYPAMLHMSLGPAAYITAAEVGTGALREKTMALSTAINVIVSFIVVFTSPYLLNILGARLGYVWMGGAVLSAAWTWLCLPELRNRSLEEIDELFEAGLSAWRFKEYQTTGLSGVVRPLGQRDVKGELDVEEVEMTEVQP